MAQRLVRKLEKVLVIDDSKLARVCLMRLLEARDLDVIEASSVDEGMLALHTDNDIGAVFMDAMMPDKDGFEGISMIKNDPALNHLPCIIYSAELSDEAQKKATSVGAVGYLVKPATDDTVDYVLNNIS